MSDFTDRFGGLPDAFSGRNILAGLAAVTVAVVSWFGVRAVFSESPEPPPAPAPEVVVAPEPVPEPEPPPSEEEPEPSYPTVLVAKVDLQTGVLLRPELVEWREWREALVLDVAVVQGAVSRDAVLGSVVSRPILTGDYIGWDRVIRPGAPGFITAVMNPDRRAVTVSIDRATTSANIIYPGDHVDVILVYTGTDGDAGGFGPSAQVIVSDVRVLAVGSRTLQLNRYEDGSLLAVATEEPLRDEGDTYTLEVYPVDAERIALASSAGRLTLAMRPVRELVAAIDEYDEGRGPDGLVGIDDVLRVPVMEMEEAAGPVHIPIVRIIRGASGGGGAEQVLADGGAG